MPTGVTAKSLLVSMSRILTSADLGFATNRYPGERGGGHRARTVPSQHRLADLRRVIGINHHHRVHAFAGDEHLPAVGIKAQMIRPHGQRQIHHTAGVWARRRWTACAG